jgi:transketolase
MSLKPFDVATLVASASKTGAVVSCEEHSVIGGLGSAVAVALAENAPCPLELVGVPDVFGTSGEPDELMVHFSLTADDIAAAARRAISRAS